MLTLSAWGYAMTITGTVTDVDRSPLAGASCVIHTLPDSAYFSSGVSDSRGRFAVTAPDTADWFLSVSYIGSEPYRIDRRSYLELTAGDRQFQVALKPAASELGEVVVKAAKPQLTMKGDALSYNVDDILKTHVLTSAHNLLSQLPLIQSPDGTRLELSGAPMGSTVYINGRKPQLQGNQLMDYLKNVPADQVKNVEIVYNPPARWKTRAAVINVVLKRQDAYTVNGQLKAEGYHKYLGSLSSGASLFAGLPKLNVNLMYNFGNTGGKGKEIQFARHTVGDEVREIDDTVTARQRTIKHTVYTALSYELTPKSTIDLTYHGSFTPKNNQWSREANSYLGNATANTDADSRLNALSLIYNSPIGLSGGVEYLNNNYHGRDHIDKIRDGVTPQPFMRSVRSQRVNRVKVYADGSNRVGRGWTLSYGASFEATHTVSDNTNTSDFLNSTSGSTTDERIVKFYAGLQRSFFTNRLFTSLSASGESYRTADYSRFGLFPRATVTFMPSRTHIFQASYQRYKSYPSFWERMDFVSYTNEYQVSIGNPTLRPAVYNVGNLIYVFKNKYVLSASYYDVRDFFFSQIYLSPDRFLQVQKLFNADLSSLYEFSLSIPVSVKKVWYGNFNLSESVERFKTGDWHGLSFDRSRWRSTVTFSNTFILNARPRVALELSGFATTRSALGLWDRPGSWSVNAGLSMSLLKNRLVVAMRGNDLFESATQMQYMDYQKQHLSVDSRFYGRTVSLSVVYKFKGYKEREMKTFDTSRYVTP